MAIHRGQLMIGKRRMEDTVVPFANFDQLNFLLLCTAHALFQMDDMRAPKFVHAVPVVCLFGWPVVCPSLHAYLKECSLQVKQNDNYFS